MRADAELDRLYAKYDEQKVADAFATVLLLSGIATQENWSRVLVTEFSDRAGIDDSQDAQTAAMRLASYLTEQSIDGALIREVVHVARIVGAETDRGRRAGQRAAAALVRGPEQPPAVCTEHPIGSVLDIRTGGVS